MLLTTRHVIDHETGCQPLVRLLTTRQVNSRSSNGVDLFLTTRQVTDQQTAQWLFVWWNKHVIDHWTGHWPLDRLMLFF